MSAPKPVIPTKPDAPPEAPPKRPAPRAKFYLGMRREAGGWVLSRIEGGRETDLTAADTKRLVLKTAMRILEDMP